MDRLDVESMREVKSFAICCARWVLPEQGVPVIMMS